MKRLNGAEVLDIRSQNFPFCNWKTPGFKFKFNMHAIYRAFFCCFCCNSVSEPACQPISRFRMQHRTLKCVLARARIKGEMRDLHQKWMNCPHLMLRKCQSNFFLCFCSPLSDITVMHGLLSVTVRQKCHSIPQ